MLFITSPVAANEADTDIETVVVTGTRATGILSEIPNTTTVIDLQQIEAQNAVSFVDLLQIFTARGDQGRRGAGHPAR